MEHLPLESVLTGFIRLKAERVASQLSAANTGYAAGCEHVSTDLEVDLLDHR